MMLLVMLERLSFFRKNYKRDKLGLLMTKGNKKFLSAIFITIFVFLVDIYILGLSNTFATTSNGIVNQADLSDATKLYALMSDTSFTEYVRWGDVIIKESTAFILLFVIIPVITFILTLLLAFRGK